jgi:hypothetical protein
VGHYTVQVEGNLPAGQKKRMDNGWTKAGVVIYLVNLPTYFLFLPNSIHCDEKTAHRYSDRCLEYADLTIRLATEEKDTFSLAIGYISQACAWAKKGNAAETVIAHLERLAPAS